MLSRVLLRRRQLTTAAGGRSAPPGRASSELLERIRQILPAKSATGPSASGEPARASMTRIKSSGEGLTCRLNSRGAPQIPSVQRVSRGTWASSSRRSSLSKNGATHSDLPASQLIARQIISQAPGIEFQSSDRSHSPPTMKPIRSEAVDKFFNILSQGAGNQDANKPIYMTRKQRQKEFEARQEKRNRRNRGKHVRKDRVDRSRRILLIEGDEITLRECSNLLSRSMHDIVKVLRAMGEPFPSGRRGLMPDFLISNDVVPLIAEEMETTFDIELRPAPFERDDEVAVESTYKSEAPENEWPARPIIVSVIGHVDHGKTTLLDACRNSNVAGGEVGAITQRIGAFTMQLNDSSVATVLDTPGHAAFSTMRINACRVTDVVVLVVAGDAGIQDQTKESIRAMRAESLPVVVAVTKSDLPSFDFDRTVRQLMEHEIVSEALGGDTQVVAVSSKTGAGLHELREAIALTGEMSEPRAPVDGIARAVVVESGIERGRGPVVTVLVRRGTLSTGDIVVAGEHWGVVRRLTTEAGMSVKNVTPSVPIVIDGMKTSPDVGSTILVVDGEQRARRMIESRRWIREQEEQENSPLWVDPNAEANKSDSIIDSSVEVIPSVVVKELRMIVRAESAGALGAVLEFIGRLPQEDIRIRVLSSAIGPIVESDVILASSTEGTIIIGFGVNAVGAAKKLATRDQIDIRTHKLIYRLIDDIISVVNEAMPSSLMDESVGKAEVANLFPLRANRGQAPSVVAGCRVLLGELDRSALVRVLRRGAVVWEGAIESLRHFKDDVPRVAKGSECGVVLGGFSELAQSDVIECFRRVDTKKQIDFTAALSGNPADSYGAKQPSKYRNQANSN